MANIDQVSQLTAGQQTQLGQQQPSIQYRKTTLLVQVRDDQELASLLQQINQHLANSKVSAKSAKAANVVDLPRRIVLSKTDGSAPDDIASILTTLRTRLGIQGQNISLEHVVEVTDVGYDPTAPPPLNGHTKVDEGAYTISKPPPLSP